MRELPKIALARLKAKPKSTSPPLGLDEFQGGQHPDANLLVALVEKSLTERERTQVLDHLSHCGECREVAAFALPAEGAVAEPTRGLAERRWSPWLVLRWGAIAAVLGALTVVVVLHPGMWKAHPEISQEMRPPVPAGNIPSAPPAVSAPPLAPPPPESVQAKAQVETRESAGEMAAVRSASGSRRELALGDHVARAQARQQVTLMASSRPPAAFRATSVPGVNIERAQGMGGNALTAGALPAPPPSPAPAEATTAGSEEAAKAGAESQAGPAAIGATAQSVTITGANTGAGSAVAAPAKVAARASRQATLGMSAPAPMGGMLAFRKENELGVGPPAALWSVSSDGKVQRTKDGGKTISEIPVAHGIKFRAIAALGNDVWAGAEGGALFHSADGGATWNRAGISIEGNAVTETIIGIQLRDPQHLTVTTASGSPWVSEDGGQHWRRNP